MTLLVVSLLSLTLRVREQTAFGPRQHATRPLSVILATSLMPKSPDVDISLRQARAVASWLLNVRPRRVLLASSSGREPVDSFKMLVGRLVRPEISQSVVNATLRAMPNLKSVPIEGAPDRLPRLDSIFESLRHEANLLAPHESALAYVNSDIILGGDFKDALRLCDRATQQSKQDWLMVGRRTELDIPHNLTDQSDIRRQAGVKGVLSSAHFLDYFAFSSGARWNYTDSSSYDIPPFVVGRPRFDNWLVANVANDVAKVDATLAVNAIHPAHKHNHAGVVARDALNRKYPIIDGQDPGKQYNEKITHRRTSWVDGTSRSICTKFVKPGAKRMPCVVTLSRSTTGLCQSTTQRGNVAIEPSAMKVPDALICSAAKKPASYAVPIL